jgi:hypothetical protein
MRIKTALLTLGAAAAAASPLAVSGTAQAAVPASKCTGVVVKGNAASLVSYTWHLLHNPHHCKVRARVVFEDTIIIPHHCSVLEPAVTRNTDTSNISWPLAASEGCVIPPDRAAISWWGYQYVSAGKWVTVDKGHRVI